MVVILSPLEGEASGSSLSLEREGTVGAAVMFVRSNESEGCPMRKGNRLQMNPT
jgi:hypothetical protein